MVHIQQSLPWYRWLKWGDFLVALLIILLAAILFARSQLALRPTGSCSAELTVDGVVIRTIPASQLAQAGQFSLEAHGYHYTVEYQDGRIRIAAADCPDQVCVRTGWVEWPGRAAACVPGHLILSLSGSAETGGPASDRPTVDVVGR